MATFQLSEDEFIRGSLALALRPRTLVMLGIAFGLIISSLLFNGHPLIESVLFALVGVVVVVGLFYFLARRRLKKIFREQQSLAEVMSVTIDEEQLSYSWARGSYILPWANVRRGRETPNFLILFESSFYGRMLPKRALSREETEIIRKNIASKTRR
jgi:YcxB-like protein